LYSVVGTRYTKSLAKEKERQEIVTGENLFPKIEQRTLSQEAVDLIRDAILSGDLAPGTHLNERDIARQMGVSRVPVREAFRRLSYEGLIATSPNRGAYVRYFTEQDIAEMFDLRATLEGMACQIIVAERAFAEKDWMVLQGYIEARNRAIAAEDYDQWLENEVGFHDYIMPRANSGRLLKTWQNMHIQCVFATRDTWVGFRQTGGTHPVILDALRNANPQDMIPLHQELYEPVKQRAIALLRK
jgi:DNA-binding GntR family transcriptional regulator